MGIEITMEIEEIVIETRPKNIHKTGLVIGIISPWIVARLG
jgi:hypothetical protein